MELDAKEAPEFVTVARFERRLRRRQERTEWVVHQVQRQRRFGAAVPQAIQQLQGLDAPIEDALSALAVNVLSRVTGQRTDEIHSLIAIEGGQMLHARDEEHGEVAPHDHLPSERAGLLHEEGKVRVQFRRTAGQVDGVNARARCQQGQHSLRCRSRHHFRSFGSRVNVAMMAGLVAQLADVDLEGPQLLAPQRPQPVAAEHEFVIGPLGSAGHCFHTETSRKPSFLRRAG